MKAQRLFLTLDQVGTSLQKFTIPLEFFGMEAEEFGVEASSPSLHAWI